MSNREVLQFVRELQEFHHPSWEYSKRTSNGGYLPPLTPEIRAANTHRRCSCGFFRYPCAEAELVEKMKHVLSGDES
jgi:hypothetical protein